MKILLFLLLFLHSSFLISQNICFDKYGKVTESTSYYCRSSIGGNQYQSKYVSTNSVYFEGSILVADAFDENKNVYSGTCKWFYKNGNLKTERNFNEKGKENGVSKYFYENGKIEKKIEYNNGLLVGNKYVEYDDQGNGNSVLIEDFDNNTNDWDLYTSEKSSSSIENGKLTLKSFIEDGTSRYISVIGDGTDLSIEMSIDLALLGKNASTGIVFAFKDWQNFDYFLIDQKKLYIGQVYEGIKSDKLSGVDCFEILPKSKNSLKILKNDQKLIFIVNGEVQYSSTFINTSGLALGPILNGKGSVDIDRLVVKELGVDNLNSPKVKVSAEDTEFKGSGSGFFINEKGVIATNYHVIENAKKIVVEVNIGGQIKNCKAEVLNFDKDNDLALIRIEDTLLSSSIKIKYTIKSAVNSELGSEVFALGYPYALSGMGKEIKYTDGKISSKSGFNGSVNMFQTTVPVQPGNSGGPMFNKKGELVGIITAKFSTADNASYAVKSFYLQNLADMANVQLPVLVNTISMGSEEMIKELSGNVVLIKFK